MLIQQVSANKQLLSDRFYRTLYESLLDARVLTSSKQAMYLNLLFRSLKADLNLKRTMAFVKRLVQVATLHQPPFVCGVLFMISQLENSLPSLSSLFDQNSGNDEDEDEHFRDAPDVDDPATPENMDTNRKKMILDAENVAQRYDGRKRDPEHSNAERSCLWELVCIHWSMIIV
jgi:ribosome biogenesis protein MAK21